MYRWISGGWTLRYTWHKLMEVRFFVECSPSGAAAVHGEYASGPMHAAFFARDIYAALALRHQQQTHLHLNGMRCMSLGNNAGHTLSPHSCWHKG